MCQKSAGHSCQFPRSILLGVDVGTIFVRIPAPAQDCTLQQKLFSFRHAWLTVFSFFFFVAISVLSLTLLGVFEVISIVRHLNQFFYDYDDDDDDDDEQDLFPHIT